jgi:hypothetical protein
VVSPSPTGPTISYGWHMQWAAIGGHVYCDVVGVHTYVNPDPPEKMITLVDLLRGGLSARGVSKPFFITETGAGSYYAPDGSLIDAVENEALYPPMPAALSAAMAARYWLAGVFCANQVMIYACTHRWSKIRWIAITSPFAETTSVTASRYVADLLTGGTLSNYVQAGRLCSYSFSTSSGRTGKIYFIRDQFGSVTLDLSGAAEIRDVLGAAVAPGSSVSVGSSPIYVLG